MKVPLKLSFKNVDVSDDIKDLIVQKCGKLEEVCDHVSSCRVAVEKDQKFTDRGRPYRVRLDITVPPGHEVVIKKEMSKGDIHETLVSELDEAFDSAVKKLRSLAEKQDGQTKSHPHKEVNGFVEKVFSDKGYGFIKSIGGREVYFHKNSVLNNRFKRLRKGTGVHYEEEQGEKGPQAISVRIIEVPEL